MRIGYLTLGMALLVVCGGVSPLSAQAKKGPASAPRRPPAPPKRAQPNPVRELQRFERMSPQQREKELSKLPPARRQQVEQRLARIQKLSPDQKEKAYQRLEDFQNLSPDRKAAVRQEVQHLRKLPESERKTRLNSEEMKNNFSPGEQKLLRESVGEQEML